MDSFSTSVLSSESCYDTISRGTGESYVTNLESSQLNSMIISKKNWSKERFEGHLKLYLSERTMREQLSRKAYLKKMGIVYDGKYRNRKKLNKQKMKIKAQAISYSGSDDLVIEIARLSYGKSGVQMSDEEKLRFLRMLADGMKASEMSKVRQTVEELRKFKRTPSHFTPFAHPQITMLIEAPIPIRTQAFKSKVGFVENEISRRYSSKEIEFFDADFNQAENENKASKMAYRDVIDKAMSVYEKMIESGVPKERARFVLPQGMMTQWYWTGSLYAYARFYSIRSSEHAQEEVKVLAGEIDKIIKKIFPLSWEALTK